MNCAGVISFLHMAGVLTATSIGVLFCFKRLLTYWEWLNYWPRSGQYFTHTLALEYRKTWKTVWCCCSVISFLPSSYGFYDSFIRSIEHKPNPMDVCSKNKPTSVLFCSLSGFYSAVGSQNMLHWLRFWKQVDIVLNINIWNCSNKVNFRFLFEFVYTEADLHKNLVEFLKMVKVSVDECIWWTMTSHERRKAKKNRTRCIDLVPRYSEKEKQNAKFAQKNFIRRYLLNRNLSFTQRNTSSL